ncbi:hypothetical protein DSCW_35920 [Desulfosarcina widdelii]|uniref:Uncharacterized protein n=1 Tax=Desulfosarcina widdelii TaxID=947919 RepID=A0A5K7Z640_9BACT|nr:hypothetical protein DSCW_35920 [Desulfosarcina widdelii]
MIEVVALQGLEILDAGYKGILPGKGLKSPWHVELELFIELQLLLDVGFKLSNWPIQPNDDIGLVYGIRFHDLLRRYVQSLACVFQWKAWIEGYYLALFLCF